MESAILISLVGRFSSTGFIHNAFGSMDKTVYVKGNMYWIPDKKDIINKYGQPDEKKHPTDSKEIWVYNREVAFNGTVIGLIIPVPIIYPAGYRKIIYEFEDNKIEKVTVERSATTSAFLCGILPLGEGIGAGCYKR